MVVFADRELIIAEKLPWISFTVHGFDSAPVSWANTEHGCGDNGDNLYTVVLFPDDQYWLYAATATREVPKISFGTYSHPAWV